MNRSDSSRKPTDESVNDPEPETTPEFEGISPLNPSTFPRAEDDDETRRRSTDFNEVPDPGPNVGRGNESGAQRRPD